MAYGTIQARKNGRYTAIPDRGTIDGKRNRNGSKKFNSRREAKQFLARIQTEQLYGIAVNPSKITVGEQLLQWLNAKAAVDKLKKTTISGYKRIIDKYLLPEFGSIKLQELKAAQIQRYFVEKSKKELIVRSSRISVRNEVIVDGVKTAKSRRTLLIPETVLKMLKEVKRRQEENKKALGDSYFDSDLVIVKDDGTPYAPISPTLRIRKICDRLGLPRMTIHGMRHTFTSFSCGIGHSSWRSQ